MRMLLVAVVALSLLPPWSLAQEPGNHSRRLLNKTQAEKLRSCEAAAARIRSEIAALRRSCTATACDFGRMSDSAKSLKEAVASLGEANDEMLRGLDAEQRERVRASVEAMERQRRRAREQLDALNAELKLSKPERLSLNNALAALEKTLKHWGAEYHEIRDLLE